MDLAVIDRKTRAIVNVEKTVCTKLAFESDIMNITVADKNFLTNICINCTNTAFIDIAVRDIELLTAKSLNTDRTTSVKTTCAYIYIISILHFKDAA